MNAENTTVVYVTREVERALGMEPHDRYRIVTNKTPYGQAVAAAYPGLVTLIDPGAKGLLGTGELLAHPATKQLLKETGGSVLVFKNTPRVEAVLAGSGLSIINPKSAIAERVENKISQVRWLGDTGTRYLPPHAIKVAKSITWKSAEPFIVQWAHGHTGDGTLIVKDVDGLRAIQEKFPERIARVSAFVSGPSFTVNAVATGTRTLVGNVSYQITGMQPFTDNQFSTVGNDWGLARKMLNAGARSAIESLAQEIGGKLQKDGWRGLFGIDVILDDATGKVKLIEVNARQPASTTFESHLQDEARAAGARGLTSFEAHIRSLLGMPIDQDLIELSDGAQIVQRMTKGVQSVFDDVSGALRAKGYDVISYENTEYNSDLLRIQSKESIMEAHNSFNQKGKDIMNAVKSSHINLSI